MFECKYSEFCEKTTVQKALTDFTELKPHPIILLVWGSDQAKIHLHLVTKMEKNSEEDIISSYHYSAIPHIF